MKKKIFSFCMLAMLVCAVFVNNSIAANANNNADRAFSFGLQVTDSAYDKTAARNKEDSTPVYINWQTTTRTGSIHLKIFGISTNGTTVNCTGSTQSDSKKFTISTLQKYSAKNCVRPMPTVRAGFHANNVNTSITGVWSADSVGTYHVLN